jgi:hypothetical protein
MINLSLVHVRIAGSAPTYLGFPAILVLFETGASCQDTPTITDTDPRTFANK